MAKKSEATATFDELEYIVNTDFSKLDDFDDELWSFVSDVVDAIEEDIEAARYNGEKSRSETTKFSKAVQAYKNVGSGGGEGILKMITAEINNAMEQCLKKFGYSKCLKLVKDQPDGLMYVDGNENDKNEFEKKCNPIIDKNLKKVMNDTNNYFSSQISGLKSKLDDFKKVLDKQNKPARKRLGHISKFCNEDAIKTLEESSSILANYNKLLSERIRKIIKILLKNKE